MMNFSGKRKFSTDDRQDDPRFRRAKRKFTPLEKNGDDKSHFPKASFSRN